jgi:iron complex transport system ATP-binding protein
METPLLQVDELAVGYPGRPVGRGFGFTLGPGQVLALLGPNGGGKTTLLKTLLGLLPAQGGQVHLDGRRLVDWTARERARRMAYVPQAAPPGFAYSVEQQVMMGRTAHQGLFARPSAADHAAVAAALDRLGLQALATRPASEISGGERQLALIARALAQDARLIVLDEPTASLDFGNQGRVLREMRRLAASGLAVLFTTHDPNQALRVADRALLLHGGAPLALGPCAEVLRPALLERVYGVPVEHIVAGHGGAPGRPAKASAFLPAVD